MTQFLADFNTMHHNVLEMAEEENANVVVSVYGKKMFFTLDLLQGMAFKNMPTTAETLILYCQKYGEEMEECEYQEPRLTLFERNIPKVQAMAV